MIGYDVLYTKSACNVETKSSLVRILVMDHCVSVTDNDWH